MLPQELTFQVREEPVYNQHGTKLDGYKQLVKDENNELIAVHKNTYRVISHDVAYDKAIDFLNEHFDTNGMTEQHKHSNNGAVMATRFSLPEYQIPFKDTSIGLEAVIWNSYNAMRSYRFDLGFYLWLCLNGLKSSVWDISLNTAHKGSGEIKLALPGGYAALDGLQTVHNYMTNWLEIPVDDYQFESEVDRLCYQPTRTDKSHVNQNHKNYILDQYNGNYAQQFGPNKFSAYQAITHWSTHYPSDSVNTRYDRERKVSNMAWFSQAS
jgi:hypothetical protein